MRSKMPVGIFLVSMLLVCSMIFISCGEEEPKKEKEPEPTGTLSVTLAENIQNGTVIITPSERPNGLFNSGDTVYMEPVTGGSYIFSSWSTTPPVTISGPNNGIYSFTMPSRAVTVNANFVLRINHPFPILKGTHANGDFTIAPAGPQLPGTRITLTPSPSNDNYKFGSWSSSPSVSIQPDTVAGRFFFLMPTDNVTINATFIEDTVPQVTTGTIQVVLPVPGETAAETQSAANVTAGGFTGVLSVVSGRLDTGRTFFRKSVYTYRYILTPPEGSRFTTQTNITVTNGTTVVTDTTWTFAPGDATAQLDVRFPRTIDRPQDPTAVDIAFGKGGTAVASNINGANTTATAGRPFEGTSHLLSSPYTVWQANGSTNAHWLSVDLGSVQPISTVVITWGAGDQNLYDGMVGAVIQVCDGPPPAWDWDENPDGFDLEHSADLAWNTPANYTNYGWKTVGSLRNLARGELEIGVRPAQGVTEGVAGGPANFRRNTLPWGNFVEIDPGTTGRYIRIKLAQPFPNGGNNTWNFGAWTDWPRISAFEVYSVKLTELEAGEVNSPDPARVTP